MQLRRYTPLIVGLAAATLAACGSSTSTASGAGNSGIGSNSSNSAANSSGSALQSVNKSSLGSPALSDANGHTLYYFKPEADGTIHCTGGCASTWPPLTYTGTEPALPSGYSGTEGSITRPDGTKQVTYNGWPLYDYAADSDSSSANGQGIEGSWFAATSTLAASGSAAASSPAAAAAAAATSNSSSSYPYN